MTTICTDGKSIAADRRVSGNGLLHGTVIKLRTMRDGTMVGCTGCVYSIGAFEDWYNGNRSEPFDAKGVFEALALSPDGTIRCFDEHGRSYVATAPQATGSGSGVAYGALDAGASPERAVEIACGRDNATGGGIDVLP